MPGTSRRTQATVSPSGRVVALRSAAAPRPQQLPDRGSWGAGAAWFHFWELHFDDEAAAGAEDTIRVAECRRTGADLPRWDTPPVHAPPAAPTLARIMSFCRPVLLIVRSLVGRLPVVRRSPSFVRRKYRLPSSRMAPITSGCVLWWHPRVSFGRPVAVRSLSVVGRPPSVRRRIGNRGI